MNSRSKYRRHCIHEWSTKQLSKGFVAHLIVVAKVMLISNREHYLHGGFASMASARPGSACPYHAATLSLAPLPNSASDVAPITRLIECAWSELPFGILDNGSVGTAASSGCDCAQTSTQELDGLALEIDALLEGYSMYATNGRDQP